MADSSSSLDVADTAAAADTDNAPHIMVALARRTAASLAAASMCKKASAAMSPSGFSKRSKQLYELKAVVFRAQMDFLHALSKMRNREKAASLFKALDEDNDGLIDGNELAKRIRCETDGDLLLSDDVFASMDEALSSVMDKKLDKQQFKDLLDDLVSNTRSTLEDMIEVITVKALFVDPSSCHEIAEEKSVSPEGETVGSKALVDDDRLAAIFRLIDVDGSGDIDFSEVSASLLHLMQHGMDESAKQVWATLLVRGKEDTRKLDFSQFCTLLLNAVAASQGKVNFDDIAADLTISACKNEPIRDKSLSLSGMFRDEELEKIVEDMKGMEASDSKIVDAVQYGKLQKLFDLWDRNHDGSIDFAEFAMGMRKFQGDEGMEETVQSALSTMMVIDDNGDQNVSRQEFATLLVKFANASGVNLHDLVDFMVVRSILRDDDEAEFAYLASVKKQAEKRMSWLAPPTFDFNSQRWGG